MAALRSLMNEHGWTDEVVVSVMRAIREADASVADVVEALEQVAAIRRLQQGAGARHDDV
jgi:hypothetical protein